MSLDLKHSKILIRDIESGYHVKCGTDSPFHCKKCGWHIQGIAYRFFDDYYCEKCYLPILNVIDVDEKITRNDFDILQKKIEELNALLDKILNKGINNV